MPNIVINKVEILGCTKEEVDNILSNVTYQGLVFNFNAIIPLGDKPVSRDLAISKWGTKWSAGDYRRVSHNTFMFETPWSHPFPVIEKFSRKFAEGIELDIKFADEDFGHNLGHYKIKDGKITTEIIGSDEDDHWEFALNLHYNDGEELSIQKAVELLHNECNYLSKPLDIEDVDNGEYGSLLTHILKSFPLVDLYKLSNVHTRHILNDIYEQSVIKKRLSNFLENLE